jgi:hypothetical protein
VSEGNNNKGKDKMTTMNIRDFLKNFITKNSMVAANYCVTNSYRKIKHYQTLNGLWLPTKMITSLKKFPHDTVIEIHESGGVAFNISGPSKKFRYEINRGALTPNV